MVSKVKLNGKSADKSFHRMPGDLSTAINAKVSIKSAWDQLTSKTRNEWICWVTSAKKEETRIKRIERAQKELAAGKKRPCCWPGCPHRRPSAAKWF